MTSIGRNGRGVVASADDAHAWFVDAKADNSELGWRMEVEVDGDWKFFDDTEGDRG